MATIIQPQANVVFVQERKAEQTGLIFIPDDNLPTYYVIVARGPDCKIPLGSRILPDFKKGFKSTVDGEDYMIFKEDAILAIITQEV